MRTTIAGDMTDEVTTSKESEEKVVKQTCPRRPYGCKVYHQDQMITSSSSPRLADSVPIVGLGCSSFSTAFFKTEEQLKWNLTLENLHKEHVKVKEWIETIHHAIFNCGINLLDTAPWYGHGMSEIVIGYALEDILIEPSEENESTNPTSITIKKAGQKKKLRREDIIVNTKVGRYESCPQEQFDFSYDRVIQSVKLSLERMKCGYIDVFQLHDPEFSPSISLLIDETIPAMLKCRDEYKLVKAIGITGYPLDVQQEILRQSASFNSGTIVFDQSLTYCHCNLFDTSLFSSSFSNYCQNHHINMMAAAPLAMGLLTHNNPPDWHPASPLLKRACAHAARLCEQNNVNLSHLATMYALAHERVSCTLIGCKSVNEVDRALHAALKFQTSDGQYENSKNISVLNKLKQILDDNEWTTLQMLLDTNNGPFVHVWNEREYDWDGKKIAHDFWMQVPGGIEAAEQKMRKRYDN